MSVIFFKNTSEHGANTAGAVVITDQNGKLPVIDGSNLTNVSVNGVSNPIASLTHQGAFGTVVTVNLTRNSVYNVSSSGPNFTITSALRTSYQNGDLIYIHMHANTWCSLVNSDTAGGTKLFVKGTETTNWRFNQLRGIIKLRLTTHTDGNLYIHTCDEMSILEDFVDITDTNSSITIGSVLRYNPSTQKWSPQLPWMPKTIVITNDNAHLYISSLLSGIPTVNMRGSSTTALGSTWATGWDTLLDNAYDSYVIIWKATSVTNPSNNITTDLTLSNFKIYLPSIADGFVGKKFTFLIDAIHASNGPANAVILASDAAANTDVIDGRDNNSSTLFYTDKANLGPRPSNCTHFGSNLLASGVVLVAFDTTMLAANQKPGVDAANYPTVWIRAPF